MRIALLLLTALIGGAAAAQEANAPAVPPAAPPAVSTEAPALSGAPAEEAAPPAAPVAEQATGAATGAPSALPAAGNEGAPAPAATTEGTAPVAPATVPGGDQPGTVPAAPATAEAAPAATGAAPAVPAPVEAASDEAPINLAAMHADLLPLFMDAHWVVKAVMVGLAIAAFAALTILVHKLAEYALAFGKLSRTARLLQSAPDLATAAAGASKLRGPAADMLRSAEEEMRLALREPALLPGVHARTESALSRIDAGAAQRLRSATGILASIGSLSPFVGLFGTVFGIMNSFLAIAETKTTNLAVVAPGIAEALLATAIGLAAAIPAVLIYNICTRKLAKYRHRLGDVASGVLRLQSREIDRFAATLSERG